MRGRMIWFNAEKGFGFIRTDDDERLYIDAAGFASGEPPEGRCAGIELSFEREIADVEGGHRAVDAIPVVETAQRRARSHRRSIS